MKRLLLTFSLILFSIYSLDIQAQGGDNAAAAAGSPITLPFAAAGTTCGHVDNYDPLYNNFTTLSGRDWLYYFCATTTGTVDVLLNVPYTGNSLFPAIMAYSTTPNAAGNNWTASSYGVPIPGSGGSYNLVNYLNSMLTITVTAGQCYYIMLDEDYDNSDFDCYNYNIAIQYHVPPPSAPLQPACTNIGYDNGNFGGWIGTSGEVTTGAVGAITPSYTPMYYTTNATQHVITSGAGSDPIAAFPVVNPGTGPNSIRLGDGAVGGAAGATLEQKFTVTASNALFVYYYAVVIQNALSDSILKNHLGQDSINAAGTSYVYALDAFGNRIKIPHKANEQPFFKTDVFDCSGNAVACGQYLVTGGPGIPGFSLASGSTDIYYKSWTPVAVDLTPFIGTCVTVRYTVGDCTKGAHFAYAYIDAFCSPLAITGINQICPTKSTVLAAPVGLFTYSWTPGGQTTQSVTVSPTVTTTYTCELTSYTNCKTFLTYSVSLFPQPIASANSATICSGTSAALTTTVNNGAGTYTWVPSGGNGSSASVSPTSTTIFTVTYSDSNGCQDTAMGRVTVNPLPVMTQPPNQSVCHNTNIVASTFTSNVAGTTFSWTNSNPAIGLAANGSGNTPGFTATNAGTSPITGIISVTPTANFCVGIPINYTITVNPIPTVNAVPSATYCHGSTVPAINFSGAVASTTYSWTNSNATIGLGASGTGNIASFGAVNTGALPVMSAITVTPSANSCVGTPGSFSINVNPIPTVTVPVSASYCHGATVPAITFSGSVTGTAFDWSNTNSTIGIATSGTGNIASFSANNTGSAAINGVITVTPSANSCVGTPASFSITVNPIPTVNAIPSATYCNGIAIPASNFTGSVTGTSFNWTNTNTTIGLSANGVGNTPGFSATNTGLSSISGVITVTPSANTCVGTPQNYTITVNPTPTVSVPNSASYCHGATVPVTTFTGNVTATVFNWSNTNSTIGIATSGTGNIASFSANNTGSAPINGVITVTPSANSCVGTPASFSITVNPIPTVNTIPNNTYCNGVAVPVTTFTGNVIGTSFDWVNSNTGIGLGASGSGNAPGYTATNTGLSSINGVVSVTPTANSCVGIPQNFTITVNPTPTLAIPNSNSYCSGVTVPISTFTGNVTGTNFNWVNSNSSIGTAPSGLGNIPSFTSANSGASPVTGVITVTPSANSCVGTPLSFSITVNPMPVAPTVANATLCPGSSTVLTATAPGGTYTWYDAPIAGNVLATTASYTTPVLSANATYYVETMNTSGCISPRTPVTVTALNFLPVSASPNQTICAGTNATLSVNPNGVGYIYSWDSPGNPAFSAIYNPVVTPATTTMYSVTVTSPNGCTGTAQTQVIVNALPIANAGNPIAFCDGQSGTIGALPVGGYSYAWLPITGLSSSTNSNPTVTLTNSGSAPAITEYTLTVTSSGCQATDIVQVTVNPLPISNAGSGLTLCAGQTGTIGAVSTTGYSYVWTPATDLSSAFISDPIVNGINAGATVIHNIYTVTTMDNATTCQSSASVTVNILPLPSVNAGTAPTTCKGVGNIPLSGSIGGAVSGVQWGGGLGSFNPFGTSLTTSYTPTQAEYNNGSMTLTLTAIAQAPCQNVTSTVAINFYDNPVISYTVDNAKGCPIHCVLFTDQSTVASPESIQSWSWNFGDGGTSNVQNPYYCYNTPGTYDVTLTATTNHQCTSTLTIPQMVEVYPLPIASFYANPPVVDVTDPLINFINTSQGADSYAWDFGDLIGTGSSNTSTLVNPNHVYTYSGIYDVHLTATSVHGCVARAILNVEVKPEFTFYIPNAFTPETSGGLNDVFTGMGIGIEKYEMWVFDRWGENIFYTNDIYKGWDGRKQGKSDPVKQDVYVWKVKIKDVLGKYHDYIGHVTLLK